MDAVEVLSTPSKQLAELGCTRGAQVQVFVYDKGFGIDPAIYNAEVLEVTDEYVVLQHLKTVDHIGVKQPKDGCPERYETSTFLLCNHSYKGDFDEGLYWHVNDPKY